MQIYSSVNNGVYRCGFATSQEAYDKACDALFAMLDELDGRLATSRFLMGDSFCEADLRLYPTLVRFDAGGCGGGGAAWLPACVRRTCWV